MKTALCMLGTQRNHRADFGELIALAVLENGEWTAASPELVPDHQAIFTFQYLSCQQLAHRGLFTAPMKESSSVSSSPSGRVHKYETDKQQPPGDSKRSHDIYTLLDIDAQFDPEVDLSFRLDYPILRRVFVRFLQSGQGDKPVVAGPFVANIKLNGGVYQVSLSIAGESQGGFPGQEAQFIYDISNNVKILSTEANYNDNIVSANFVIGVLSSLESGYIPTKYSFLKDKNLFARSLAGLTKEKFNKHLFQQAFESLAQVQHLSPIQSSRLSATQEWLASYAIKIPAPTNEIDDLTRRDGAQLVEIREKYDDLKSELDKEKNRYNELYEVYLELDRNKNPNPDQNDKDTNQSLIQKIDSLEAKCETYVRAIAEKDDHLSKVLSLEALEDLKKKTGREVDNLNRQYDTVAEQLRSSNLPFEVSKTLPILKLFNLIEPQDSLAQAVELDFEVSNTSLFEFYIQIDESLKETGLTAGVEVWALVGAVLSGRFTGFYGMPGTGKTVLAEFVSQLLAPAELRHRHSVFPTWTSSAEPFGSYNPFSRKFDWAHQNIEYMFGNSARTSSHFKPLVFDEAALAPIEEYLASLMPLRDTYEHQNVHVGSKTLSATAGNKVLFTLNPNGPSDSITPRIKDRTMFFMIDKDSESLLGNVDLSSLQKRESYPSHTYLMEEVDRSRLDKFAPDVVAFREMLSEELATPLYNIRARSKRRIDEFADIVMVVSKELELSLDNTEILSVIRDAILIPSIQIDATNIEVVKSEIQGGGRLSHQRERFEPLIEYNDQYGIVTSVI